MYVIVCVCVYVSVNLCVRVVYGCMCVGLSIRSKCMYGLGSA